MKYSKADQRGDQAGDREQVDSERLVVGCDVKQLDAEREKKRKPGTPVGVDESVPVSGNAAISDVQIRNAVGVEDRAHGKGLREPRDE